MTGPAAEYAALLARAAPYLRPSLPGGEVGYGQVAVTADAWLRAAAEPYLRSGLPELPLSDDERVDALVQALEELAAEIAQGTVGLRRRAWDPSKHPRGPDGRFLSTVDSLKDAIRKHRASGGGGDPFDGFDREQLRRAAKARGITLARGESRESIAAKLLADLDGAAPTQEPATARERLAAVYGERLHVTQTGEQADKHLRDLAEIPEPFHRHVEEHFSRGWSTAGIYIGDGGIPELSPQAAGLRGQQPRGHPAGSTWDSVAGAYMPDERQLLIGDENRHRHGSVALAAHEFGHALDDAFRSPSRSDEFRAPVRDLAAVEPTVFRMEAYMDPRGNPEGWASEAFAEAFAGWSGSRSHADAVYAVTNALGTYRWDMSKSYEDRVAALDPRVQGPVGSLIRQFEQLQTRAEAAGP